MLLGYHYGSPYYDKDYKYGFTRIILRIYFIKEFTTVVLIMDRLLSLRVYL